MNSSETRQKGMVAPNRVFFVVQTKNYSDCCLSLACALLLLNVNYSFLFLWINDLIWNGKTIHLILCFYVDRISKQHASFNNNIRCTCLGEKAIIHLIRVNYLEFRWLFIFICVKFVYKKSLHIALKWSHKWQWVDSVKLKRRQYRLFNSIQHMPLHSTYSTNDLPVVFRKS